MTVTPQVSNPAPVPGAPWFAKISLLGCLGLGSGWTLVVFVVETLQAPVVPVSP